MNRPSTAPDKVRAIRPEGPRCLPNLSAAALLLGFLCQDLYSQTLSQEQQEPQNKTRRYDPNTATSLLQVPEIQAPVIQADGAQGFESTQQVFEALQRAENGDHYHLHQVRRILDGKRWLAIAEELWIAPSNRGEAPRFKLSLEDIEGRELAEAELDSLREEFSSRSAFLFLHSTCRIIDPRLAEHNYSILDLGHGMRIERPVSKILILPKQPGSPPWALELDRETGYPLYRAEYDQRGQIIATLEVSEFQHGLSARAPAGFEWWRETRSVTAYADLDRALRDFPARGVTLPDSTSLPSGYELWQTRLVNADLNDELTLVQSYSDGIEEIFLLVTVNASRPVLLQNNLSDRREVSLMTFHDMSTSQYMFFHGDLRYQLIGRTGQGRLNSLARSLIRKAYR